MGEIKVLNILAPLAALRERWRNWLYAGPRVVLAGSDNPGLYDSTPSVLLFCRSAREVKKFVLGITGDVVPRLISATVPRLNVRLTHPWEFAPVRSVSSAAREDARPTSEGF